MKINSNNADYLRNPQNKVRSKFRELAAGYLKHHSAILLKGLLLLLFTIIIIRNAWLNDDAYITFRTADNFINGYGLTWNPAERVQTFTHPLWLFLLIIPYAITREIYYTSLVMSIGVSLTAAGLIGWRLGRKTAVFSLALLSLAFSKAYIDYATSGLENPLTHLLLVLFLTQFFYRPPHTAPARNPDPRPVFWLSLIAALGILNRTDTLFLFIPPLLWAWWQQRSWPAFYWMLAGFTPLILWESFSIFYYGFPFPNTAYAKALTTGIPESALWRAGWAYLQNSMQWDPLTLTLIIIAIGTAFLKRHLRSMVVAIGILLYLLYVVKIGGDFMSGRFLTAPLLTAVILLVDLFPASLTRLPAMTVISIGIILLGLQAQFPPLFNGGDFGSRPEQSAWDIWHDGDIADERVYYYPYTGLINPNRQIHPWQAQGQAVREELPSIAQHGNIGFFGFFAGPNVHILDTNALADPLLARLPIADLDNWRIGHLKRAVPPGYVDTLITNENRIQNPDLAAYYDKLRLLTRGDLIDGDRLRAIVELNLHPAPSP